MARTAATNRFKVRNFGTALSFDGIDDKVAATAISGLSAGATISVWIKPTVTALADSGVLWNVEDTNNRLGISIVTATGVPHIRGGFYNGTSFVGSSSTSISGLQNNWLHVVYSFTGSSGKIYVNSVAGAGVFSPSSAGNVGLFIGQRPDGVKFFQGKIDEPRIWNRALTADEISALYYQGTVPTTGLVAEYLFNEGAGTTATDSSGNGNDGTITGATYTSDVPSYEKKSINANLVKNGDFEFAPPFTAAGTTDSRWIDGTAAGSTTNDVFGWAQVIDTPSCSVSFDSTVSHSGGYSIKVDATDATGRGRAVQGNGGGGTGSSLTASTLAQYAIVVSPSTSYTITYWIKTLNATTGTNRVAIHEHKGDGTRNTVVSPDSVSGTNDWTQVTMTFTTQATTRYIVLSAQIATAGEIKTVWFDDISLTPTTPITRTAATGRVAV